MRTVLLVALMCEACGYRFSVGQGALPDGSRRLCVPVAHNLSGDPSAGVWFTGALRREAVLAGLEITDDDSAPRLVPRVVSIRDVPRGVAVFSGRFRAREQEVVVRVKLDLELEEDGVSIALTDRESYLSAPDLRGTEANKKLAMKRVIDRLAREGLERLALGI
jgi:hypothetical protein